MINMSIFKNIKIELHIEIIAGIILAGLVAAYSFLWFNSCAPVTEHWSLYYSELINRGSLPYKDFYYYLPPLNLMLDFLLWKISFGKLIVYTGFRLIERILLAEVIYFELSKYFDWRKVWVASLCGIILGTANPYEMFGDYTQSATFLLVFLLSCIIRFVEKNEAKHLVFAGIFFSLEFFMKQNVFIAVAITFFFALITFCVLRKDHRFFKYIGYILCGSLPVFLFFMGIMFIKGMLFPFFEQVYIGVDSKGSLWHILFGAFVAILNNPLYILFAIFLFLTFYFANKKEIKLSIISTASFICLLFVHYGDQIKKFIFSIWKYGVEYIIVPCIFIFVLLETLLCKKIISKTKYNRLFIFATFVIFLLLINIVVSNDNIIAREIFTKTGTFELLDNFDDVTWILICILGIYFLKKNNLTLFMFISAAFALSYSVTMSNGGGVAVCSYVLLVPISLSILTSIKGKYAKFINYCIYSIAIAGCFICMCQKVICPYSWWGCTSYPLAGRTEKVNNDFLTGYRLTLEEKVKYEELTNVIVNNTSNNSVVYGFPQITIFNFLTDHYSINGFVPVPWYDVCSTKYAKAEADLLANNPPDIVVWCDIPNAIEVHESLFLNGNQLGQREIIRWFASVEGVEYQLIGQVDNVFVYKLIKNEESISYTYIQDPLRINSTLNMGY